MPAAISVGQERQAHPVMVGVAAIMRAHEIGKQGSTFHEVARRAGVSAQSVHNYAGGRSWTPETVVIMDAILGVFGFELAIRKIPETGGAHRIEPMVNADNR